MAMTNPQGVPAWPAYVAPRAQRATGTATDRELAVVKKVARVLDTYMVDPLVGLVLPGIGDVLMSMFGLYTVSLAARRGISPIVIARMLLNLALDALLGIVPFLGDLFDLGFKANNKNLALLVERNEHGGRATAKDWMAVVGALLVFLSVIGLVTYGVVAAVRAIV